MKKQPLINGNWWKMSYKNNLKPFNQWDKEEHRKASAKGGINSGISRRKKREAIEKEKAEIQALIEWSDELRWLMKYID